MTGRRFSCFVNEKCTNNSLFPFSFQRGTRLVCQLCSFSIHTGFTTPLNKSTRDHINMLRYNEGKGVQKWMYPKPYLTIDDEVRFHAWLLIIRGLLELHGNFRATLYRFSRCSLLGKQMQASGMQIKQERLFGFKGKIVCDLGISN